MERTVILKVEVNKQIFIRAKRSENSLNTHILLPAFPAAIRIGQYSLRNYYIFS